jgi:hypothetical protein
MSLINIDTKNKIITLINTIIEINDKEWKELKINIKLKIMHHYLNLFNKKILNNKEMHSTNNIKDLKIVHLSETTNESSLSESSEKYIPLKMLKPKKILFYSLKSNCINNYNKIKAIYSKDVLLLTEDYRKKYVKVKNRIYYRISNLPIDEKNNILEKYNEIVYNILNNSIKIIDADIFYNNILGNNYDKIIDISKNKYINIIKEKKGFKIIFNKNIVIIFELTYSSDIITNNIPVKYIIKLLNIF